MSELYVQWFEGTFSRGTHIFRPFKFFLQNLIEENRMYVFFK